MLTTERLWIAYARVRTQHVKGANRQRQLSDVVALVRFALGHLVRANRRWCACF